MCPVCSRPECEFRPDGNKTTMPEDVSGKIFILEDAGYEHSVCTYFVGAPEISQEHFRQMALALMDRAALRALKKQSDEEAMIRKEPGNEDYVGYFRYQAIIDELPALIEEQGFVRIEPKRCRFFTDVFTFDEWQGKFGPEMRVVLAQRLKAQEKEWGSHG